MPKTVQLACNWHLWLAALHAVAVTALVTCKTNVYNGDKSFCLETPESSFISS